MNTTIKITSVLWRYIYSVWILGLLILPGVEVMAETYYSQGSVAVNNINSWNTLVGGGGFTPVDFTGTHTWIIQSGHNMGMTGDWTPGGTATVIIDGGLTVSSTYLVSITGSLTVNGTLTNAGTYTTASATTATGGITVNGTYNHNQNDGYIPIATWSTSSTCMVTGWTSAPSLGNSSFDQPFVNFAWNCPNQTVDVSYEGHVATVSGTFILASTGPVNPTSGLPNLITPGGSPVSYGNYISTGGVYYVTADATEGEIRTVSITGDFLMDGGHFYQGRHGLSTLTIGGNYTMRSGTQIVSRWSGASATVYGNFLMTGGFFRVAYTGSASLTVMGDFSITGPGYGTFYMSDDSNSGILYVAGNFTYTAGLITENPAESGVGVIVFNGPETQTYTSSRMVQNTINFIVNNGSTLQMASGSTAINGAGTFTLSDEATLGIRSANGINTSGTSGDVQVTGTRNFATGANYIYNGTTAQVTGTGLTQNIPANLTIANSAGVTLSGETALSGVLTLNNGIVNTGTNTLILSNAATSSIIGGSASLYVNGNLRRNIAAGENEYLYPIGTSSAYAPVNLSFGPGTEAGYLNGTTIDGDHASIGSSDFDPSRTINRTWNFSAYSGLSTLTCDAAFNWVPADLDTGFDDDNPTIGQYSGSGWIYPLVGTWNGTNIIATGLTGFGDFQVGNRLNVSEPTLQASGVTFSNVNSGSLTVSWTNGYGAARIVLLKSGSVIDSDPSDRTTYMANAIFGNGTQIGTGNYVVYKGSGSTVDITGLNPGTTYYVAVYEYNGPDGHEDYLIVNPATGSRQTPATGDYRSIVSGNWNAPGTWEFSSDNGSTWTAASATPSYLDDQIIIRQGHTINVSADINVDQVVVVNGGTVTLSSGLAIVNGIGDDFVVDGTLNKVTPTSLTQNPGSTLVFNNGGKYIHANNGTTIPYATWNTGSTCEITGWTNVSTLTPSFNQTFYNFTWNCPLQTVSVSFAGYVASVTGTFTLVNTGNVGSIIEPGGDPSYGNYLSTGGTYNMTYGGVARTVRITNDFSLGGSGIFHQSFNSSGTLIIGRNFLMENSGFFSLVSNASGSLSVMGDFSVLGGTFRMSRSSYTAILYVAGDFTHTGGSITETGTGSGEIIFNGTEIQTYTSSRTIGDMIINFTVNYGATLQMAAENTVISGNGTFTLLGGGTLGITSANGIMADPVVALGNIQTTSARVFSEGANFIYNGTVAQVTGTGLTQNVPANLLIQNSSGVTLSDVTQISNSFSIYSGSRVNLGSDLTHTANILILGGNEQPGGSYGGTGSAADHILPAYFYDATGILNNSLHANTWLGVISSGWNTPSNWSGGVPLIEDNVIINSTTTYQPVIFDSPTSDPTAVCKNLTINTGATLTINAGQALTIGDPLFPDDGIGNLTNSGTLNMLSDANGISSLIVNSISGFGKNNLQLYLTGGGDVNTYAWHYISSPVNGVPVESTFFKDMNDQTWDLAQFVENIPTDLFAGNPSYNWQMSWVGYDGWSYFDQEGDLYIVDYDDELTTGLKLGKGYNFWDEGSDTYMLSGTINTSDPAPVLTFLDRGEGNEDMEGYNLLGNPFSCGLNIEYLMDPDAVPQRWPENTLRTVWFTSNSISYVHSNGVSVPGVAVNGHIPPMQGFFVKTQADGVTFNFPAEAREHNSTARYKGEKSSIPLVRLSLSEAGKSEETVVRFNEKAKSNLDLDYDAPRFMARVNNPSIYTSLEGIDYTINGLPFPETSVEVPITVKLMTSGNHIVTALEIQELNDYYITLTDKIANSTIDLRSNKEYAFSASSGLIKDRFILTVTNATTGTEDPLRAKDLFSIYHGLDMINILPLVDEWNGKTGSVSLIDMTGKTIRKLENAEFVTNSPIQIPSPRGKGIFLVELKSGVMRYVGKVIIR